MSRFSVDTDALKNATGRCEDISNSIGNLAIRIDNVKYSLDNSMGRYSGVLSALDTCIANSYKCSNKVEVFGSYGTMFATGYRTYEDRITGNIKLDKFGNVIAGDAGAGFDYHAILEMIGKFTLPVWLLNPITAIPTSALITFMNLLYGDDPTETKDKVKSKLAEYEHNFWEKGIKKEKDKDGKWVDAEDEDDGKKKKPSIEVDVKVKEWESEALKNEGTWKEGVVSAENEYGSASASYKVGSYETHGSAYVGLGTAGAAIGASVTALSLDAQAQLGDENLGLYTKGNVTVGKASAEAEAKIGIFDKNGNVNPSAKIEASAEIIGAQASGTVGAKVMGTDVGVTGSVQVGLGAHANVGYADGKFSLDIGASLGVGASVKLDVDVSGTVNAVCDGARSAFETVSGWFGW